MWCLHDVDCPFELWFSDGRPVKSCRGGDGVSSRAIVDHLGFLDLTEIHVPPEKIVLDANGSRLVPMQNPVHRIPPASNLGDKVSPWLLSLKIESNGSFVLRLIQSHTNIQPEFHTPQIAASGHLKPLPEIRAEDAAFIDNMMAQKYVPYQNIPDAPGKTVEEIRDLGQKLFPFSPFSFQLAMCVYDWTTASFTRLVFLKIFQYTGIPPEPFPIDKPSIAEEIWGSNWPPYTPQNADYMRSFLMTPVTTLEEVQTQLKDVSASLHNFSIVENRLLSAAMQALPRTSIFSHHRLFSGQVDIFQLGLDHFGIELLECPLNSGPENERLIEAFATVLASYVSAGKTITTKMVWSFTDTEEDAMHYSNGILLVANFPGDSAVWETAAYVTPLSDDPKKTEYTFMPGSRFDVQSVFPATINDKPVTVVNLQPKLRVDQAVTKVNVLKDLTAGLPGMFTVDEAARVAPPLEPPHTIGKTAGRRCACFDVVG